MSDMPTQATDSTELTEIDGEYSESETYDPKNSNLVRHAEYELDLIGVGDSGADYSGALKTAVMELIHTFAAQGHSGSSARITLDLFNRVARYEPLGDIGLDPDEWSEVAKNLWQNKRRGTTFSHDAGKTWYDIDDASLNNGATWYSQEDTDEYLAALGLDPDPDLVLDTRVKSRLWDEAYELQAEWRKEQGLPNDGSVMFDADFNRELRQKREQGKGS